MLLNEVFRNLIFFFESLIKKVAFMMLILRKFQSLNAKFMVYTFICAFWKIIFFWLLWPSKSSRALKKDSTFGFLTFGYALKKLGLGSTFLRILSCVYFSSMGLSFFTFFDQLLVPFENKWAGCIFTIDLTFILFLKITSTP